MAVETRSLRNQNMEVVVHEPGLLTLFSDGSFQRPTDLDLPACPSFVEGLASMDVVINPSTGLWARIFLPELLPQQQDDESSSKKLPVVVHFHGGGFCVGSPATPCFHDFCSRMAFRSCCIWISVAYRLAPEHPLPAAYDDAFEALLWLHSQASAAVGPNSSTAAVPWLAHHADFSKCILAGESAGGAIVHFLAVRAAANAFRLVPIRGLLVIHAAFTQAKPKANKGSARAPPQVEFYHRSMLPGGAPVDHPFLNPLHSDWPDFSQIELPPLLVAVAEKDVLRRGSELYYEALKRAGKDSQFFASKNEIHCFHLFRPRSAAAELLEKEMIDFIGKVLRASSRP